MFYRYRDRLFGVEVLSNRKMKQEPTSTAFAKFRISRLPYYAVSSLFLLFAIKPNNLWRFIADLLSINKKERFIVFRNGLSFYYKTYLDLLVLKEVILDDEYEMGKVRVTSNDRIIVDVGAGFGDFSIMIAKKYPSINIFAFEPEPSYFALLQKNIVLNKVNNVHAMKMAVNSIQKIFGAGKIDKCDFLKMDCEGCEFRMIQRRELTYLRKIKKIVMEYHTWAGKVKNIQSVLQNGGFDTHIIHRRQMEQIGMLIAKR